MYRNKLFKLFESLQNCKGLEVIKFAITFCFKQGWLYYKLNEIVGFVKTLDLDAASALFLNYS